MKGSVSEIPDPISMSDDSDHGHQHQGSGDHHNPRPLPASPLLTPARELELLEAYRDGDPEAIGTLLRSYQNRLYAICYRMVRHEETARDLTQDALIKVLEGIGSFDGRSALSTWIIRVTMNHTLSYLRKQKLRRHASLDRPIPSQSSESSTSFSSILEDTEPSPAERIQQDQERARVVKALGQLDPAQKAILILRDMNDLDYQQIAEILDVPVGTVKSRLFRARLALRNLLSPPQRPDNPPQAGT